MSNIHRTRWVIYIEHGGDIHRTRWAIYIEHGGRYIHYTQHYHIHMYIHLCYYTIILLYQFSVHNVCIIESVEQCNDSGSTIYVHIQLICIVVVTMVTCSECSSASLLSSCPSSCQLCLSDLYSQ